MGFRIAKAHIVFDELWPIRANHQTGEKHALERRAARGHSFERWRDDRSHDTLAHLRIHDGRGRISAHAAGVGTAFAFPYPLVILGRSKAKGVCAIAKREKRHFLAFEKILDDDRFTRFAKQARKHVIDGGFRLAKAHGHGDALARREPIGLDHGRRAFRSHKGLGGLRIGETRIGRGWNRMPAAKRLGKGLRAFEPGRRLARTEGFDSFRRQMIDNSSDERRLGTDHDEINRHHLAKGDNRGMIGHIEHDGLPQTGHAGIARRDEKRREQRTFRKRDGDGMFPSAGTKKKNIHDGHRYSGGRPGKSHKSIELSSVWL